MNIELTEQEILILDSALESLNRKGLSRQDSQEVLRLTLKLQGDKQCTIPK